MIYTLSTTAAFDMYVMVAHEGYSEVEARRIVLFNDLLQAQAKRKCATIGHRIVDSSYGGTESGCVDLHCDRCGYHYHVTLY